MSTHIVAGVVNGSIFALLAVGIVLVYQITGVLNFAFGSIGMVAVYAFSTLTFGLDPWLALAAVTVGAAVAGAIVGALTVSAQPASPNVKAVATLGLVSALQGLVVLVWGVNPREVPRLARGRAFTLFDIGVSWQRVFAVAVAIGLTLGVMLLFRRSALGAALRAMAESSRTAKLVGLPVRRLWVMAWSASTAVAAFAAVFVLPEIGFDPAAQTFIILIPFAAALVARFQSVSVAFVTALVLGVTRGVLDGVSSLADYRDLLPLLVVLVSLTAARTNHTYERV